MPALAAGLPTLTMLAATPPAMLPARAPRARVDSGCSG